MVAFIDCVETYGKLERLQFHITSASFCGIRSWRRPSNSNPQTKTNNTPGDLKSWKNPWVLGVHLFLMDFDVKHLKRLKKRWRIILGIIFFCVLGFFFGFLGWYHLPSVCNGLELEFVILHGICHIWACSPSILHGTYYMWACSPSILYGICHILACSPSILHGISYMWACSPSILYGICHILACSPSILHGMFYMWACFTDAEAWD